MSEVLPPGYDTFFSPSKADVIPKIDTLEWIANQLEWTLCELMCGFDSAQAIQKDLLEMAVTTAVRATPSDQQELLTAAILEAYDAVVEHARRGPIEPGALAMLEASLRARSRGR